MQYKIGSQLNKQLVRAMDLLDNVTQDLDCRESQLRDQWDARPDSWKESEQGQRIEAWLDLLQEFVSASNDISSQYDISDLDQA